VKGAAVLVTAVDSTGDDTVLKKTGIVVATAAAGLLALSPLAFAGDYKGDHDGDSHHSHDDSDDGGDDSADVNCEQDSSVKHEEEGDEKSLISVSRNTLQVPIQACGNDILSGVLGIVAKDQSNESND
jgi:hypothetical protein